MKVIFMSINAQSLSDNFQREVMSPVSRVLMDFGARCGLQMLSPVVEEIGQRKRTTSR